MTGNAAEVATQFRGILQSFIDPTEKMTTLFTNLGFSSSKMAVDMLGVAGALNAVKEETNKSGETLKSYIPRVEALTLALSLTGAQSDAYQKKTEAMNKVQGASNEAFKQVREGIDQLGFKLNELKNKVVGVLESIGAGLTPVVTELVDEMGPFLDIAKELGEQFTSMDSRAQLLVITKAALLAAIGPIVIGFALLLDAVGSLVGFLGALSKALSSVISVVSRLLIPLGAVLAAIAGIILVVKNVNKFMAFFKDEIYSIKKAMEPWINQLKLVAGFLLEIFATKTGFAEDMEKLAEGGKIAGKVIKESAIEGVEDLKSALSGIKDVIAGVIPKVKDVAVEFSEIALPDILFSSIEKFSKKLEDLKKKAKYIISKSEQTKA